MKISENTSIAMPMRNLISIIGACIVGAWFGFGVIERLNIIETEFIGCFYSVNANFKSSLFLLIVSLTVPNGAFTSIA